MTRIAWSIVAISLAALPIADAAEAAATQAGVSAAVRGQVDLTPVVDETVRPIGSGEDVFLGDALKSHEQSGLQLMLLDESSVTLGPNAEITIDAFIYDPATGLGEVTADLAEGVFRFVTGKLSQGQDNAMTLKLPYGVIGIRGTIGAVRNDAARSLIVLLGAGSNNNADQRSGAIDVTAQGRTVSLIRPGFGTIIEAGQPPAPPFELSDEQLASILVPLAPPPSLPPDRSPSTKEADRAAGQDTAEARLTSLQTKMIQTYKEEVIDDPIVAHSQDVLAQEEAVVDRLLTALILQLLDDPVSGPVIQQLLLIQQLSDTPSPISLFQQLLDIPSLTTLVDLNLQTGQGNYEGTFQLDSGGSYDYFLEIDFVDRTVGGGFSKVEINDPDGVGDNVVFILARTSFDFTIDPGNAIYGFQGQVSGIGGCQPCEIVVVVALSNASSIAGTANQIVSITNGVDVSTSEIIDQASFVEFIPILDGITTFDELRTIETGQFEYNASGTFTQTLQFSEVTVNIPGTLTSLINIDFGARTIGGGGSFIAVDTTPTGDIDASTSITAIDFSSLTGLAENVFSAKNIINMDFAGTNVTLNNLDGIIANTATTSVIFADGSSEGNGSVTSGPLEISSP